MSAITIEVPEAVRLRYLRLAEAKGVSFDQFLVTALDAGIESLESADYLEQRAARAVPGAMRRILDRVPPGEPEEEWDHLPPGWQRPSSHGDGL